MYNINVKDDNDWGYALGQILGRIGAKMYDSNMNRQAYKNNQQVLADAGTDDLRSKYKTADNELSNYVKANDKITNDFKEQADKYNAATSDSDKAAIAAKLNQMGAAIDTAFDPNNNQAWTQALSLAQQNKGANQTDLEPYTQNLSDLRDKVALSEDYANAMKGTKVSDGTFQRYKDYMNKPTVAPQPTQSLAQPQYDFSQLQLGQNNQLPKYVNLFGQ